MLPTVCPCSLPFLSPLSLPFPFPFLSPPSFLFPPPFLVINLEKIGVLSVVTVVLWAITSPSSVLTKKSCNLPRSWKIPPLVLLPVVPTAMLLPVLGTEDKMYVFPHLLLFFPLFLSQFSYNFPSIFLFFFFFSPQGGSGGDRRQGDDHTVRVTNLSEDTKESDLHDLFSPFGSVKRVFLVKDKKTGAFSFLFILFFFYSLLFLCLSLFNQTLVFSIFLCPPLFLFFLTFSFLAFILKTHSLFLLFFLSFSDSSSLNYSFSLTFVFLTSSSPFFLHFL